MNSLSALHLRSVFVSEQVEEPAAAFRARLDESLAADRPLTGEERRARAGLMSRQLTLR